LHFPARAKKPPALRNFSALPPGMVLAVWVFAMRPAAGRKIEIDKFPWGNHFSEFFRKAGEKT